MTRYRLAREAPPKTFGREESGPALAEPKELPSELA
jgi:hypothetical protein